MDAVLDMLTFVNISGFSMADTLHLKHIGQEMTPRIPELTDRFYVQLLSDDRVRPYVENRLEALKKTHMNWLTQLFTSEYDDDFMAAQRRIGAIHVAAGIPPLFVAAIMSFLRSAIPDALESVAQSVGHPVGYCIGLVLKLLDICQYLIDSAYAQERMRRLTTATGMRQALLENLIALK